RACRSGVLSDGRRARCGERRDPGLLRSGKNLGLRVLLDERCILRHEQRRRLAGQYRAPLSGLQPIHQRLDTDDRRADCPSDAAAVPKTAQTPHVVTGVPAPLPPKATPATTTQQAVAPQKTAPPPTATVPPPGKVTPPTTTTSAPLVATTTTAAPAPTTKTS